MKRFLLLFIAAVLLSAVPSIAKSPRPTPTPENAPKDAAADSDLRKIKVDAYVLSSVEDKTVDGEPIRDIIIEVNSLANEGHNPVTLSFKSFQLKDPATSHLYAANGTNSGDFSKELPVSPLDGDVPSFKLFFKVPGDLRPETMYLRVGDELVMLKLQK